LQLSYRHPKKGAITNNMKKTISASNFNNICTLEHFTPSQTISFSNSAFLFSRFSFSHLVSHQIPSLFYCCIVIFPQLQAFNIAWLLYFPFPKDCFFFLQTIFLCFVFLFQILSVHCFVLSFVICLVIMKSSNLLYLCNSSTFFWKFEIHHLSYSTK
jgi:hypothetical protein